MGNIRLTSDNTKKKHIYSSIEKKRKKLLNITARLESLKMELSFIKREYDIRIGRLLLKDNELDIEIIRLNNILNLMETGKSYYEAEVEVESFYYDQRQDFKKTEEEIDEEKIELSRKTNIGKEQSENIKKIWRRLIFKYHPDLTTDIKEKKKREELMKTINTAYAENDISTLRSLEGSISFRRKEVLTIHDLEKKLSDIENLIIHVEREYLILKSSEWFFWRKRMQKARLKNDDVFFGLEKKLLDDIVKKIAIAQKLRIRLQEKNRII